MTKKKTAAPTYVTKQILKKELSALEERLGERINQVDAKIDSKVDTAVQSMKEYTDNRFMQFETKITGVMTGLIAQLNANITANMKDIKRLFINHEERIEDHEHRIGALEEKAG